MLMLLSFILKPDFMASIVILCLVVIAWQWVKVLPYTPIWPVDVGSARSEEAPAITLLIANVLRDNRQSDQLIEQIVRCQPDIVLTLESDHWWEKQLDEAINKDWTWSAKIPLDNLYGMHLYSRLPLENLSVDYLIQDDIPSIHTWVRLNEEHRVRLHAVHPRPPVPGESRESLWRDAELMKVGEQIQREAVPAILAGDLNDVAWSKTTRQFCRLASMSDPRRGRGLYSSFHARWWFLRWPLDHLFLTREFRLKRMQTLSAFGSDHFPILVEVTFEPGRSQPDSTPEATSKERKEAQALQREASRKEQPEDEKSS